MAPPGSNLEKFKGFNAILIWMILSCAVILFNKAILNAFPFSITLTTWHMLCATMATRVLARTTGLIDTKTKLDMKTYLQAFVPIGLCFSFSLILSNMVYLYLSMSFIQMLKALGPVATLLACWSIGLHNPPLSYRIFLVVCVIVGGVMLASFGELQFVLLGLLIQMAAIVFEAYKNALQQFLLSGKTNVSSMTLLYYFAPICTITNTLFIFIFEWNALRRWLEMDGIYATGAVVPMKLNVCVFLLNGVLTFSLTIASVNVIKQTSSLVLTLAGIPKAIMLMALDIFLYKASMTKLQVIGFTIAGLGTYHYSRLKESAKDNGGKGEIDNLSQYEKVLDEEALADLSFEYNEKVNGFRG